MHLIEMTPDPGDRRCLMNVCVALSDPIPTSASVRGTELVSTGQCVAGGGGLPKPTPRLQVPGTPAPSAPSPQLLGTLCKAGQSRASSQSPARPSVLTFSPLRPPAIGGYELLLPSHRPTPSWASEFPTETSHKGRAHMHLKLSCHGGCGTGQRSSRTLKAPPRGSGRVHPDSAPRRLGLSKFQRLSPEVYFRSNHHPESFTLVPSPSKDQDGVDGQMDR